MSGKSKPGNLLRIVAISVGTVVVCACAVILWRWAGGVHGQETKLSSTASYVGQEQCEQCHAEQVQAWRDSHHAKAMQVADHSTVLGNFNDARFAKDGVTSNFLKRDAKFYVRTDGPDGKPREYELPYTFGVSPLQQYLVPFPNGRLQSFVVAWDSRNKDQGAISRMHVVSDSSMILATSSWLQTRRAFGLRKPNLSASRQHGFSG